MKILMKLRRSGLVSLSALLPMRFETYEAMSILGQQVLTFFPFNLVLLVWRLESVQRRRGCSRHVGSKGEINVAVAVSERVGGQSDSVLMADLASFLY